MGKEKRLTFYDIAASQAHSVKTFDGKTYELKGTLKKWLKFIIKCARLEMNIKT
jgi:hypothetical protein